jgi:predicted RNase H-like nuclease (RuvC/YqgF family)
MSEVNAFMNGYELGPELRCNHCSEVFYGSHECQMDKLKSEVQRLQVENVAYKEDQRKALKILNNISVVIVPNLENKLKKSQQKVERLEKALREIGEFSWASHQGNIAWKALETEDKHGSVKKGCASKKA